MFVVLWRTPCSLKFPKGRSLESRGESGDRGGNVVALPLSYPSLIECTIEKISHIDMKVRWSPVLLEINLIFILKEIIKTWNHDLQHLQVSLTVTVSSKKYRPINPLEDRPHHTATLED